MSTTSDVDESSAPPSDWAALVALLTLVIGFTYSDDIVEFVNDIFGGDISGGDISGGWFSGALPWMVFALDCLLVAGTAALKWRMDNATEPRAFLRRLVAGKWGLGAALMVVAHLVLIATVVPRARMSESAALAFNLLSTLVFVTAMTLLLVPTLTDKADRATRSWVIPVVLGILVAQLASALWYPVINTEPGCAGDVASWYFSDMCHITPVILLTLGIELGYVRRTTATLDAGQRVVPLLTVIMLGAGLMMAFSMMVKADMPKCGTAAVWHEYSTFVFTAQALTTGLATVIWLLISTAGEQGSGPSGQGVRGKRDVFPGSRR